LKLGSYNQQLGPIATFFLPGIQGNGRPTHAGDAGSGEILSRPVATAPCNNTAPLACALTLKPAVIFIEVGTHDVAANVPVANFAQNLNQAVGAVLAQNVIPVLVTIADIPPGQEAKYLPYNEAIANTAT